MTENVLMLDFAGEILQARPGETLTIGREGSVAIDDNPYLHRRFLEIGWDRGFWWVANVGTRIAVEISDGSGRSRSTLGPGGNMPVVFDRCYLVFAAGPTEYEIELSQESTRFVTLLSGRPSSGDTTVGPSQFTQAQLLAVLALAEPLLRRPGAGVSSVRTAVEAAQRLGWSQTRFNRKLDNVCDKLDRAGVSGLKGGLDKSAASRRTRLTEYAISTRLVSADDLAILDAEVLGNTKGSSR